MPVAGTPRRHEPHGVLHPPAGPHGGQPAPRFCARSCATRSHPPGRVAPPATLATPAACGPPVLARPCSTPLQAALPVPQEDVAVAAAEGLLSAHGLPMHHRKRSERTKSCPPAAAGLALYTPRSPRL